VPSLDTGLTFVANLSNPFPNGVSDPPGASLGLATFLGRDLNFYPVERQNGFSQRWVVNFQREMPGDFLVEAGYVGNKGYDLTVDTSILNTIPRQYLSTKTERDQTTIDFLSANVANPFANLIPGTSLNGSTAARSQLLRPYPAFTGFTFRRNDGHTIYHSGQFRVEKRFSRGYTLLASYTVGKMRQWASFLNESDTEFEERFSDGDRRHRWVASGILELPFGKQKRWGGGWNGFVDAILGGWQGTGMFQYQSGGSLNFDNNILLRGNPGDVALPSDRRTIDSWFNTSLFETASAKQLANNIRTAPRQFPSVTQQPINLWDLSILKNFSSGRA
jgi:hypothetical protein